MKYNRNNNLKRTRKGWIIVPLALLSVCVGSFIHNNNVHASNRNSISPVTTQNINTQNEGQSLGQPNLVNNNVANKSANSFTPQTASAQANSLQTGIVNRALTQAKTTNYSNNTQESYQPNSQKNNRRLLGQNNDMPNNNLKYGQGSVTVPVYEKSQGQKNLTNNVTITVREPVGSTTALWTLFSGKSPVYTYSGHSLQSANGNVTVDKLGRVSLSPDAEVTYVGNSNGLDGLHVKIPVNNSNGDSIVLQLPDDVSVGSDILLNNGMIKSNPGNKYSIHGDVPIYYSDGPNDIVHKIQEYGTIVNNSKVPSSSAIRKPNSSSANINSSKASLSSNTSASRSANSTSNRNESSKSNAVSSHSSSISSASASSANSGSTNVNSSNALIPSQESTPSVTSNSSTADPNATSNTNTGVSSANSRVSSTNSSITSGISNDVNDKSLTPSSMGSQSTLSMPLSANSRANVSPTTNSLTTSSNFVNRASGSTDDLNHGNQSRDDNATTPSSASYMDNGTDQSASSKTDPASDSAMSSESTSSQNSSDPVEASSTNMLNAESKGLLALNNRHGVTNNDDSNILNKSNKLPQTGDFTYNHPILNASTLLMLSAMLLGLATDIDKHRFN